MRVTNKMLSQNFLRDMRNNLQNLQKLQGQMTSGKEIRKPSDDPFKVARAMQLQTDINANKQYNENISDTINWLDTTDTALDKAGSVFQRVRELLISAGDAGYGSDERRAIKDEINQKVGELTQILNTNFDGKYVFGGTRGTTKPMNFDNSTYTASYNVLSDGTILPEDQLNMIGSRLSIETSQGVTMEYNVTAKDVMEFTNEKGESIDLFNVMQKIINHLDGKSDDGTSEDQEGASEKLNGEDLQAITDTLSNLLKIRSEVGAKQNRMESAQDKNTDENFNMTELLSKTEDIDITEKTMEYATMQTVYVASLQTSAKVLQPTLLDYLN